MPKSRHHFALAPAYLEYIDDTLLAIKWPGVGPDMAGAYRNRALLESAAMRPFQTACRNYIHRGVPRRAAALFHSLIANHPFGDGNKRTAVTAVHQFLLANGLLLVAHQQFMYDLALQTASAGEREERQDEILKTIARTLKLKTVKISEMRRLPSLGRLHRRLLALKREIRANPLNRLEQRGQSEVGAA